MNKILIFLIFLVIVIIALIIYKLNAVSGGITDDEIQEQLAKLQIKGFRRLLGQHDQEIRNSEDFIKFKNDRDAINKLLTYIAEYYDGSHNDLVPEILSMYNDDIMVLPSFRLDFNYLKSSESVVELNIINNNAKILLQPIGIIYSDPRKKNPSAHVAGLLINNIDKEMIYMDPHIKPIMEYEEMVRKFAEKLKFNNKFSDYKFLTLADIYNPSCPAFQRSFIENEGMCTIWSVYLFYIFINNNRKNYGNIIKIHERNPNWTKRRLEEFAYKLYKQFESSFSSNITYREDFTGPVKRLAEPEDCEGTSYPFYSALTKKCYEFKDDLYRDEDKYRESICKRYGNSYNPKTKKCEIEKP